jgi:hypothetical protein
VGFLFVFLVVVFALPPPPLQSETTFSTASKA